MVRWNIEKTALWKGKDTDKETFDVMTGHEPTNISLLAAVGIWAIWQQKQKEKKARIKEGKDFVILTPDLVTECFADKKDGAQSFVVGGLDSEQEALLRRGMDKLVGAEFW